MAKLDWKGPAQKRGTPEGVPLFSPSRDASSSEIKEKVGELAKQGLIEPTWKMRKEKARVPDGGDLIPWIGDEIT